MAWDAGKDSAFAILECPEHWSGLLFDHSAGEHLNPVSFPEVGLAVEDLLGPPNVPLDDFR